MSLPTDAAWRSLQQRVAGRWRCCPRPARGPAYGTPLHPPPTYTSGFHQDMFRVERPAPLPHDGATRVASREQSGVQRESLIGLHSKPIENLGLFLFYSIEKAFVM